MRAAFEHDTRRDRATALNPHGLLAHWGEIASETWVTSLLGWEEHERARRSLERRLRTAYIGRFKPLCDFDWAWPKRCDRAAIDTLVRARAAPYRVCNRDRCPECFPSSRRLPRSGATEGGSQAGGKFAGQGGCGAVVEVIRQGINSSIRLIGCPTAILVRISLR